MSWKSKVVWSEGLFLRPQHFQQGDRYVEGLIENRVRHIAPYPWGFAQIEIDRDLAQQGKFGLRRAAGLMPDGTPFDVPDQSPLPEPIVLTEAAAGQVLWLLMPVASPNTREVDDAAAETASRYVMGRTTLIDSTAALRLEEEIEVAHPRLSFEVARAAKPGFQGLPVARVVEVRDRAIVFDERFAPPVLTSLAHPVVSGWLDRVIGWVDNALEELARYAADPTAGGGLSSADYFMLILLNRHRPVMQHLRKSQYVHPERLYEEFLRLAGELATFGATDRRARLYPPYDHNALEPTFTPVLRDIQDFLMIGWDRRAVRLELVAIDRNKFYSLVRDRNLFRTSAFIVEVGAQMPLTEIQSQFPRLFKIGPNTKMQDIVNSHLPGIGLVHLPTPPPQIKALMNRVYFLLDRQSPLWQEFSTAASIGLHFAGNWPDLEMELWAVKETRS